MATMKMVEIDGQKLKAEIIKRFKTYAAADRDLGFSGAVGNWINRNVMPEYATHLLAAKWGLTLDEYKIEEKPVADEQAEEEPAMRKGCHYCNGDEETVWPLFEENGKLHSGVCIIPRRNIMSLSVSYGSEPVMDADTMIHYCPFCGRKL